MKISLATNFDNSLIDQIKGFPVYEIYGKMRNDFIGGGRPDNELAEIEQKTFEEHVKKATTNGIKFNYLLNGSCTANKEQSKEWQKQLYDFLKYLNGVGVTSLTVTNPFILISDFFWRGNFNTLSFFNHLYKFRCFEQTIHSSSI